MPVKGGKCISRDRRLGGWYLHEQLLYLRHAVGYRELPPRERLVLRKRRLQRGRRLPRAAFSSETSLMRHQRGVFQHHAVARPSDHGFAFKAVGGWTSIPGDAPYPLPDNLARWYRCEPHLQQWPCKRGKCEMVWAVSPGMWTGSNEALNRPALLHREPLTIHRILVMARHAAGRTGLRG